MGLLSFEEKVSAAKTLFFSKLPFLYPFLTASEVRGEENLRLMGAKGYVTPDMVIGVDKDLSTEDVVLTLVHECLHLAHGHLIRFEDMWERVEGFCSKAGISKMEASNLWNYVTDAYVNWVTEEHVIGIVRSLSGPYRRSKRALFTVDKLEAAVGRRIDFTNESPESVFIELLRLYAENRQLLPCGFRGEGGSGWSAGFDVHVTWAGRSGKGGRRQGGEGAGSGMPSGVRGAGASAEEVRRKLEDLARMAESLCRSAGNVPAWVERMLGWVRGEKVLDWRRVLRSTLLGLGNSELSYSRVSKPMFVAGYRMPSASYRKVVNLIVGIDTSGSIRDEEYRRFVGEVINILSDMPFGTFINAYFVLWDAEVKKVVHVDRVAGMASVLRAVKGLGKRVGYGGTCIVPFLDECMRILRSERGRFNIVVLTDGHIFDLGKARRHPIRNDGRVRRFVWVSTGIVDRLLGMPNEVASKMKL